MAMYELVRSVNTVDEKNIYVVSSPSTLVPKQYEKSDFDGDFKTLFNYFLLKQMVFAKSNAQKIRDGYLRAILYLREEGVDTEYITPDFIVSENSQYHLYKKALQIFLDELAGTKDETKYIVHINGQEVHKFKKYGYECSPLKRNNNAHSFRDYALAKIRYGDSVEGFPILN